MRWDVGYRDHDYFNSDDRGRILHFSATPLVGYFTRSTLPQKRGEGRSDREGSQASMARLKRSREFSATDQSAKVMSESEHQETRAIRFRAVFSLTDAVLQCGC